MKVLHIAYKSTELMQPESANIELLRPYMGMIAPKYKRTYSSF